MQIHIPTADLKSLLTSMVSGALTTERHLADSAQIRRRRWWMNCIRW